MIRDFFKKANKRARAAINFVVRIALAIVYFVIFFPIFICFRLFSDFLEIKDCKSPRWIASNKIEEAGKFLHQQ